MTLSDLAAIGSFISGVAVLASLIFVGFQLRQNTQAVRAEASQAHAANFQKVLMPIIDNEDVAHIWRVGLDDIALLKADERTRFLMILSGVFRFYESTRLQWRHGQIDTAHWENVEPQAKDLASLSGVKLYWKMRRHWHSPEFCAWFESLEPTVMKQGLYDPPLDTA